ncbi:MAG: cysteine desulfurase family protein [bacterium]
MSDPIYLDYNATTPIHPEVAAAMRPVLEGIFGNPSSSHPYGREARRAVEQGREQLAMLLGCPAETVVFTGGGTESNNLAIQGIAYARRDRGNHLVTTLVEHPAVAEVMSHLERQGFAVTRVGVDGDGRVDPAAIEAAITPATTLLSVMHANNEVGTVMDLADIAAVARKHGIVFHTDAAQSVGKIATGVDELGVDLLSVAGHKLYAPKGVGALYIRPGTELAKLFHGADHEAGRRPGTENVLGIVGLGAAAELAAGDLGEHGEHLRALRDRLHEAIRAALPNGAIRLNGHAEARLPNTLNLGFRGVEAAALLAAVPGVAASAGAACHSGDEDTSSVLGAMGVPTEYAGGAVRFSTGRGLTMQEVDRAGAEVVDAVARLLPH